MARSNFFQSAEFLFACPSLFQKFQRLVELGILSKEIYFHMPYRIFILKKPSTLSTYCFKAAATIDQKPKRVKYFIFCAPK